MDASEMSPDARISRDSHKRMLPWCDQNFFSCDKVFCLIEGSMLLQKAQKDANLGSACHD